MLRIVPIRRYPRCYTCVGALFPGVREAPCCPFAAPRQSRSRAATATPFPSSCPAAQSHPFPHAAACPSHGTAHERWRHASSDARAHFDSNRPGPASDRLSAPAREGDEPRPTAKGKAACGAPSQSVEGQGLCPKAYRRLGVSNELFAPLPFSGVSHQDAWDDDFSRRDSSSSADHCWCRSEVKANWATRYAALAPVPQGTCCCCNKRAEPALASHSRKQHSVANEPGADRAQWGGGGPCARPRRSGGT